MGSMAAFAPQALQAAGTLFGSFNEARSTRAAAEAEARAYDFNAAIATQNAIAANQAAQADAQQIGRINRARHGQLKTNIAASGVAMEGTSLLILDEDIEQGALDVAKTIQRGQVQAANYTNESTMQKFNAGNIRKAGRTRARQTLLSGIAKTATNLIGNN